MVDFRRMIPVLAVIAFLLGSAVTASAQSNTPFQCFANGGVSTPARSEDITALVGDLVLNCQGGVPTAPGVAIPPVNIQVFLNTSLTSRLLTTSTTGPQYSEALLLLDDPQPGLQFACNPGGGSTVCPGYGNGLGIGVTAPPSNASTVGYYGGGTIGANTATCTAGTGNIIPAGQCPGNNRNVFQAIQTTSNSVTFLGVPIDPPGTSGSRIVRITNIRGNANALGVAGANATPTPIVETISPTPPQFLPVSNPSQTVAFIQRGMTFGLFGDAVTSTAASSVTLQQCDSSRASSSGSKFNVAVATLRYTENFATAFRKRFFGDDTASPSSPTPISNPSGLQNDLRVGTYNTESGFVNPALSLPSGANGSNGSTPPGTAGLADWGSRLKAVFNNIPNGVSIFVDVNSSQGATIPDRASLTSSETGAFSAVAGGSGTSNPHLCVGATGAPVACSGSLVPIATAQLTVTNGTAVAIWEVLQSDPNTFAALNFNFFAVYTPSPGTNSPALATATVNGSYAPTSTVTVAANANVPRFADTSTATNVFTVVPCLTTLLFPYLTNASGFDTGIAISATATDPFATTPQSGGCTLNWYGKAFTGATAFPAASPAVINSGTTEVGLVSNILNNVTGGFTGYMIAVCRFQYAHGFAFISDLGARNLAMGYLALVIPDPTSSTSGRLAIPSPCGGANNATGNWAAACVSTGEGLTP